MSVAAARDNWFGSDFRYRLFTAVKYLVYLLLSFNVYLFLQEELSALEHTFVDGFDPGQIRDQRGGWSAWSQLQAN